MIMILQKCLRLRSAGLYHKPAPQGEPTGGFFARGLTASPAKLFDSDWLEESPFGRIFIALATNESL